MTNKQSKYALSNDEIDFNKPFHPAHLTTLYHTPSWQHLSPDQQLAYTQHYGLYLNEQTAFFEEQLAEIILPTLQHSPDTPRELAQSLKIFQQEEREHTRMFRALSNKVNPTKFSLDSEAYYFIKVPPLMLKMMRLISNRPQFFNYWIWLALLQEERSIAISRACINDDEIEPTFQKTHLIHLQDEANHVQWDLQLLDQFWKPSSKWKKSINVFLFHRIMREFFTAPKRAAINVINELIAQFPELEPMRPTLYSDIKKLKTSVSYHRSLYSRTLTPRAFKLFDQLPEFIGLENTLLAYDPA